MNPDKLAELAKDLNDASNKLAQPIKAVEAKLKRLNLGLKCEVVVDNIREWFLGYGKVDKQWGIYVRSGEDIWLFSEAPRYLRILGIKKLQDLLDALEPTAEAAIKRMYEAVEEANMITNTFLAEEWREENNEKEP
jgi:hypothetical protein